MLTKYQLLIWQFIYMSNPFAGALKKSSPSINPLDFVLNNKTRTASSQGESRNVFKPQVQIIDEDRQNNKNEVNTNKVIPIMQKQVQQKVEIQVNNKRVLQNFASNNDKVRLEMKVNNQACEIRKIKDKELRSMKDLNVENMQIKLTKNASLSIKKQMKTTQYILNCLQSLYLIIREDNQRLLKNIRYQITTRKSPSHIHLRSDEHNRLNQGLYYYQPIENHTMEVVRFALTHHKFGKLASLVSQKCRLDILKAYYVVRSVHEKKGVIKQGLPSFFLDENQSFNLIPQTEIVQLSQKFLNQDKACLLLCYNEFFWYLKGQKPSTYSLLKPRQELDMLWGNLFFLEKESLQNQQHIITLFVRYWTLSNENRKKVGEQLYQMRQRILGMKINDILKIKVIEIGINDVLNYDNQSLEQSAFEGPYKEMFTLFIQKREDNFNYQLAFQNLSKIQLSQGWMKHVESYLQSIIFNKSMEQNLLKIIYIYKVLIKLKANKCSLPLKQRQSLVIKVMKECSIIMGLIFLNELCEDVLSPKLTNCFIKCTQKNMKLFYFKEESIIFKWIQVFSFEKLIQIQVKCIKRVLFNAIQMNDIETLEREITSGKVYYIDFEDQKENFQFIKYYCQFLLKYPSFQMQIQENINELLGFMQAKQIKILKSVECYHQKLLQASKNSEVLAIHLVFLFKILNTKSELIEYAKEWTQKVDKERTSSEFKNFPEIVCMVGQKLLEMDQHSFLPIYYQFIRIFNQAILQTFSRKILIHSEEIRMYYVMRKVAEWSELNNLSSNPFNQASTKMKEGLLNVSQDLNDLMRRMDKLNPAIKLLILCEIVMPDGKMVQNGLNSFLSLRSSFKFQLYETIRSGLKKKTDISLIEAFSYAAFCDEELLQILILKNIHDLINTIKATTFNLTSINYLLTLGSAVATTTRIKKTEWLENLLSLIIYRTLKTYKYKEIPDLVFKKLFNICADSWNRLEYITHLEVLKSGRLGMKLNELKSFMKDEFYQYLLYLLCLFISTLSKKDLNDNKGRGDLADEVDVFTLIANLLLKNTLPGQKIVTHYLMKYLQMLDYLLCYPILIQLVTHHFDSFKETLQKALYDHKQILLQLQTIESKIQIQGAQHIFDHYQPAKSRQMVYNQHIRMFFDSFGKVKEPQKRRSETNRLLSLLKENVGLKLKINYTPNFQVLIDEKSLAFTHVVSLLVKNIDFESSRKEVVQLFKKYLLQFDANLFLDDKIGYLTATKHYLSILNELISTSSISPFILLSNAVMKQQLTSIISNLTHQMSIWMQPPNLQFLKTIDNVELEINYFPEEWKSKHYSYSSTFTLWSLFLFREKLELIKEILAFYRIMNGLLQKQYYGIVFQITHFLIFFSENIDRFLEQENLEKISKVNNILKGNGSKIDEKLSFFLKQLSLKQLTHLCKSVADDLACLNIEIPLKVYHSMERLNRPLQV